MRMFRTARRQLGFLSLTALVAAAWLAAGATPLAQGAGAADPSLYSGMRWRSVGPDRGGRSITVGGSDARIFEYWFGATGGGAWKTTDGGNTWRPMTDGKITSSSIGAIGVCEANPDVVYIGGGEVQFRGNIIQGDGLYKTTDGGETWTHLADLRDSQTIARVRIHPTDCNTAFAAVFGQPYAEHEARGIYKTIDGGQTWRRTLFRNARTGAADLSIDPNNPNVMYAGLWEAFRTPHSMSSGGPGSGLFKSVDGGETWTELTRNPGLPEGIWGKVGVSVSPADANRVYAMIDHNDGGLFSSDDAGATWQLVNDNRNLRQRAFYYTRVVADTQDKDTVYVLNVQFFKSTDGGKTTATIRVPHGDNHDLWIAPSDNTRLMQANDGGGNVSFNGGETWSGQGYPTGQFYNVFTTTHVPYHICGAQQDNSTACISSESQPGAGEGSLPPIFYSPGGGESGYIAADPNNTDVFFAGSYGGLLTRLDRSTGQRRVVTIYPNNPMGHSSIDIKERFQWTFPIVYSPVDPQVLYASSQHLFRTTNGGQSWLKASPDLTRADPDTMQASGGPITRDQTGVETYATIFTIAPSRQDVNTIWTGSDDGYVHITRDGGANWQRVTPAGLPDYTRISLIEASPHENGVAYLAGNLYQRGDRGPYVYKTADFGKTWTKIVTGIPDWDFARVIREDPTRRGLLYLGTEHGVYVSFNDGASWQSLQLDLPTTPVHGLVVEARDLVIGTHGRGFYVLDDINVLRQATGDITSQPLHIFQPTDPLRGLDTSVAFDYYLGSDAEEVKIEVLDAQGAVLRSFTGTPKKEEPPAQGGGFGFRPPTVAVSKGMNRFSWDLRQDGAVVFPGMIMWAAQPQRGPASPPGRYTVRISALGEQETRDFTIGLDPRLRAQGITEADLQEQFTLSTRVRDRVSEANTAVIQIRGLRDQINERIDKVPAQRRSEIQRIVDGLLTPLTEVEEEIYQVRNRSGQDPLNYPIKLNNKIAALSGVVESADNKPTDQTYEVFDELSVQLEAELRKMNEALETELPRLNSVLQREKIEPVVRPDGQQ